MKSFFFVRKFPSENGAICFSEKIVLCWLRVILNELRHWGQGHLLGGCERGWDVSQCWQLFLS